MVNVDLISAIITKVSNALNTLVSGEKPGFQALSKGLIVLLPDAPTSFAGIPFKILTKFSLSLQPNAAYTAIGLYIR